MRYIRKKVLCMGKIKRIGRRFLACLMIVFTLSCNVTTDYMESSIEIANYEAEGAEIAIAALVILVCSVAASMGLTFSNKNDAYNCAYSLQASAQAYPDYEIDGVKIFQEIMKFGTPIGSTLQVAAPIYKFLKQYIYDYASNSMSSAATVSDPITDLFHDSTTFYKIDFSTFDQDRLLNGKKIYYDGNYYDFSDLTSLDMSKFQCVLASISHNADTNATGLLIQFIPKNLYLVRGETSQFIDCLYAYDSTNLNSTSCTKDNVVYNFRYDSFNDYYKPSTSIVNGILQSSNSPLYYGSDIGLCYSPDVTGYSRSSNVYLDKTAKIYSSKDQIKVSSIAKAYAPSSKVYGNSDVASGSQTDESTGTVTIGVTSPDVADAVADAIADAIANNPGLTEEEANAIASDVIAAQNGTTDAVNQNTKTLSTLLTSILAQVKSIAANVSKISVGGGTAALDWTDVQEAFEEETVSGSSDNDNDDDEPKVWVPPKLKAVGFLAPLLMLLGGALSNLSAFQSKILGVLEGVEEWIMDIPENIGKALDKVFSPTLTGIATGIGAVAGHLEEWIMDIPESIMDLLSINELPLDLILTGILGLPLDVVKALNDSLDLDIDIPDIAIPNYKTLLDRIIELLEGLFLIDTAALAVALSGFELVWEDKLPFGEKLLALFNEFYFSSNYNYPVIKVRTPQILTSYYDDEYIVLLDFADYKQYVLWARNLVKACLWFAFALSIFSHLRTNLHIG